MKRTKRKVLKKIFIFGGKLLLGTSLAGIGVTYLSSCINLPVGFFDFWEDMMYEQVKQRAGGSSRLAYLIYEKNMKKRRSEDEVLEYIWRKEFLPAGLNLEDHSHFIRFVPIRFRRMNQYIVEVFPMTADLSLNYQQSLTLRNIHAQISAYRENRETIVFWWKLIISIAISGCFTALMMKWGFSYIWSFLKKLVK